MCLKLKRKKSRNDGLHQAAVIRRLRWSAKISWNFLFLGVFFKTDFRLFTFLRSTGGRGGKRTFGTVYLKQSHGRPTTKAISTGCYEKFRDCKTFFNSSISKVVPETRWTLLMLLVRIPPPIILLYFILIPENHVSHRVRPMNPA